MNSLTQLTALTNRILKQNFKSLDTIVTVIAMPVFMLLFFVYIFGGNITLTNTSSGTAGYRIGLHRPADQHRQNKGLFISSSFSSH